MRVTSIDTKFLLKVFRITRQQLSKLSKKIFLGFFFSNFLRQDSVDDQSQSWLPFQTIGSIPTSFLEDVICRSPFAGFAHFSPDPFRDRASKKGRKKWTKFMSKVGSNQLQHWIKFCLTYKGWKNMLNYILKLFCESECREFSFCQALPFGYYTLHRVVKHLSKTMKKNKKR